MYNRLDPTLLAAIINRNTFIAIDRNSNKNKTKIINHKQTMIYTIQYNTIQLNQYNANAYYQLVENHDCLFDDACAPELALDFDCQNVSTAEGFASWGIAIGLYITLFNVIKYVGQPDVENPAISRADSDDIVIAIDHHN